MNTKQIYEYALKNKIALGAFNFASLECLKGILEASEETNMPVILAMSESALSFVGENYVKALIQATKSSSKTPLIFHLDHGKSLEICKRAISLGFDSVMIDGSSLPLEENIKLTKSFVNFAHKNNVWVEAELGSLSGIEDDVNVQKSNAKFTNPQQAKEFVEKTKCDSLAIAMGTSHGAYKFSGKPHLRIDILEQIENMLPNYPLVLHGASSVEEAEIKTFRDLGGKIGDAQGVSESLLKEVALKHNIVKINMDTDLRIAFTNGIRENLLKHPENLDTRKYLQNAQNFVKNLVKRKILMISRQEN